MTGKKMLTAPREDRNRDNSDWTPFDILQYGADSYDPPGSRSAQSEEQCEALGLEDLQFRALQARLRGEPFMSVIHRMVALHKSNPRRMTWALGSSLRAYWIVPDLGFEDLREVSRILMHVSDQLGLDLCQVLESTNHLNASQGIADWLSQQGIDPNAFHAVWNVAHTEYSIRYDRERARPLATLVEHARRQGTLFEETQPTQSRPFLTGLLRSLQAKFSAFTPAR